MPFNQGILTRLNRNNQLFDFDCKPRHETKIKYEYLIESKSNKLFSKELTILHT